MAKTLRGSMIVGRYKEQKDDFTDHGQVVTIDDDGVHFECKTTPYGFVAPDAKIWFQTFNEQNENGESVEREYLMTTGYLWTKAFPEANKVIEEGRPQSMELDNESVKGKWTDSINNNHEIFIINDAVFSKLCILGEDVEPCFEGASITKPEVCTTFDLDDGFRNTVYTMMQELQQIQSKQGGKMQMGKEAILETPVTELNASVAYAKDDEEDKKKKEDNSASNGGAEDKAENKEEKKDSASAADDKKEDDENEKKKNNFSLINDNTVSMEEYNNLKDKYSSLEKTIAELTQFKIEAEREKKNDLINKFTMLSREDKADVVTNIDKYSLEDIESKLSIKCFRQGLFVATRSANIENEIEIKNDPITTYSLAYDQKSNVPDWIRAVEENSNN